MTRRLGAVVALVMALAGCVSIPDSGPVQVGPAVSDEIRQPRGQFYADRPLSGATPAAVVRGFIAAGVDFNGDHDVARAYLTNDRAKSWRALRQVLVRDASSELSIKATQLNAGSPTPSAPTTPASLAASPSAGAAGSPSETATASVGSTDPADSAKPAPGAEIRLTVTFPIAARVSAEGTYTGSAKGDVQRMNLTLRAVAGEWRIADAPDGIVLTPSEFAATYVDIPLYFPDRSGLWLVPDIRWLPLTSTPTSVVGALFRGPASWLTAAVATAVPSGTALTTTGVRRDGGQLLVDLTAVALQADGRQRQLLQEQIQQTLNEASRVMFFQPGQVRLTVDGSGYEVPLTGAAPPKPTSAMTLDSSPVVIDNGNRLARLSGGTVQPIPDLGALPPDATHPAMAPDGSAYAYLTQNKSLLSVVAPKGSPSIRLQGAELSPPSIDLNDWVWSAPAAQGEVFASKGEQSKRFAVSWLKGLSVLSLRVSPEGSRMVIVARRGTGSFVLLAAVTRNERGEPTALGEVPQRLAAEIPQVEYASWLADRSVAVLGGNTATGEPTVFRVQIAGRQLGLAALPNGLTVTTGSTVFQAWAQTRDGAVQLSGERFVAVPGARWPAVPG